MHTPLACRFSHALFLLLFFPLLASLFSSLQGVQYVCVRARERICFMCIKQEETVRSRTFTVRWVGAFVCTELSIWTTFLWFAVAVSAQVVFNWAGCYKNVLEEQEWVHDICYNTVLSWRKWDVFSFDKGRSFLSSVRRGLTEVTVPFLLSSTMLLCFD